MEPDLKHYDGIYRIDSTFPKTTNLEYFATEILLEIFSMLDDNSLLQVAQSSHRFESIALVAFKERYANRYFAIKNESAERCRQKPEIYRRFGEILNAIEFNGIYDLDENYWMIQAMNAHAKRIKKLQFIECHFNNIETILSQHNQIDSLTFQRCTAERLVYLPEFRNLQHLEARDFVDIEYSSYECILKNSNQLESLAVSLCNTDPLAIISWISEYSKHIKRLHLVNESELLNFESSTIMNVLPTIAVNLESLGLSIDNESVNLLRYLREYCGNIKQLELIHIYGVLSNELIEVLHSFDFITTLSLKLDSYQGDVDLLLKSFPHLRDLTIIVRCEMPSTYCFILSLLKECCALERVTIDSSLRQQLHSQSEIFRRDSDDDELAEDYELDYVDENPTKYNINLQFFEKFIEIIKIRQAQLELKENGKTMATVSKHEILWRDMLVHWRGYDSVYNRSGINLMDLARKDENCVDESRKQTLEFILDYLDLSSLYSFYNVNKRCKQLITDYVEKRSMQNAKFVVTDEFDINYDAIRTFGHNITDLKVNLLNDDIVCCSLIKQYCENLIKLSLNQKCKYHSEWYRYKFIYPSLRNFVFESTNAKTYFNLSKIPAQSQLETLEFKSDVWLRTDDYDPHLLRKLKRIKVKNLNYFITSFSNKLPHIEIIVND